MSGAYGPRLSRLLEALRRLPGVGPKSAQRMAFHLLGRDRDGAAFLRDALAAALAGIERCPRCRMYCEDGRCAFCVPSRETGGQVCVVETPADLLAIESSTGYRGRYFVLGGRLSPLDGIGPEQLGLDRLESELTGSPGSGAGVRELIIAINPSVEGEATAYYLGELGRRYGATVTRIAYGVPLGGELESTDGGTLARAFTGRTPA
ncbi:MAG: recombination mediator RecR [Gammaproteobacteria bacterium]|nr:recombination mediator RecR [Gammaproteobacteria bacterium]